MEVTQEKTKVTVTLTNDEANALQNIIERGLMNYDVQDESLEVANELYKELYGEDFDWVQTE